MLKNLKKRRAQLIGRGELAEAKAYNFFPVSFEMPKVCTQPTATSTSKCMRQTQSAWVDDTCLYR